ncbi:hypothetical protein QUF90_17735 [Desulfococcaceae bacterium HSG9]|nr:hypothetical protein [Desulfococcaceae bacterium HSG9]
MPIAEIKPIAVLPNKKRPIGLAGKEYPDFQICDAFLNLSRVILLPILMAKARETFPQYLHFSLVDSGGVKIFHPMRLMLLPIIKMKSV